MLKSVRGLLSVAALATLNNFAGEIAPVMAESKLIVEEASYSQKTETVLIAGFGDFLGDIKKAVEDGTDTIENVDDTISNMKERDLQQREREQALKERQRREEELAAARKAARQQEIEEAERRRQYFNSLSLEEKQAYVNQQQELRQQEEAANLLLLGLFASFLIGGDGGSSSGQTGEYVVYPDNNSAPTYNPAPASTKPIDPFYGDCHSPMGC